MSNNPIDQDRRDVLDLDAVMKSPSGRSVLKMILLHAGVYQGNFDPENDRRQVFNEGRRNEGLWLMDKLKEANPGQYKSIIVEIHDDAN